MARRRTFRRGSSRRRSPSDWTANSESVFTSIAAGTPRQVTIFAAQSVDSIKHTILRVVGTLECQSNADVAGNFHYGCYKSVLGAAGALINLDPILGASVSEENWLFWGAASVTTIAAGQSVWHLPIDIKVKRILDVDEALHFVINSNVAHLSMLNVRVLAKVTGT